MPEVETAEEICESIAAQMPADVLTYMNPGHYCESDLLARFAYEEFGQMHPGVCRNFSHLAISLCRGIGIPALYVSGYAVDLQPPDFHGFMEAYLNGQWFLFKKFESPFE